MSNDDYPNTSPGNLEIPAGASNHPYPQLDLMRQEIVQIGDRGQFPEHNLGQPSEPLLAPYALDRGLEWRQSIVPEPPHEIRTPATFKYPKSRDIIYVQSGVNLPEKQLGFSCRSIVVQNAGTNTFLFCPEASVYLSLAPTPLATFNLPTGIERVSFEWHTAAFNRATPAAVPGQIATIWLFDEWVIPTAAAASTAVSIIGTIPVLITAFPETANAPSNARIAQNAANVALLAANPNRLEAVIVNDSTAVLYVNFGAAASSAAYVYRLASFATLELPQPIYTGAINGIWDAAGTGGAQVTEIV